MAEHQGVSRREAFLAIGTLGVALGSKGLAVAAEEKGVRERAAPKGSAKLEWRIVGPDKPEQHACGDVPPTAYMVVARAADVVNARVLHVIWHKTAIGMPEAIDRVIVDTDVDQAATKTPHYGYFYPVPHHSNPAGELIFAICYFDFCSVGKYDIRVTVVWEDISEVEIDDAGGKQVNHRRFLETKTKSIESQRPDP